MPSSLQVTAAGWLLLSFAHTVSAKDWQTSIKFKSLSSAAYTCSKAGWYQGSAFFVMNALLNYGWSKDPSLLYQPVNQAIGALMVAIMWVSSAWYAKGGVASNAVATAAIGALQAFAILKN